MRKIYIVEDDEDIREIVEYALQSVGFETISFECGEGFFSALTAEIPDLIVLDIMLPSDDGLTILKKLRDNPRTKKLPVILLTAKSSEFDKVKGLDLGADDYLTKPFSILELISRINAVLRRSSGEQEQEKQLEYGSILIDNNRREVTVTGEIIDLTYKEYELLHFLMLNKELALNRSKIIEEVWGYDFEGESRTLDMHIHSLRQKLGAAGDMIITIRNVGYRLGV